MVWAWPKPLALHTISELLFVGSKIVRIYVLFQVLTHVWQHETGKSTFLLYKWILADLRQTIEASNPAGQSNMLFMISQKELILMEYSFAKQ